MADSSEELEYDFFSESKYESVKSSDDDCESELSSEEEEVDSELVVDETKGKRESTYLFAENTNLKNACLWNRYLNNKNMLFAFSDEL